MQGRGRRVGACLDILECDELGNRGTFGVQLGAAQLHTVRARVHLRTDKWSGQAGRCDPVAIRGDVASGNQTQSDAINQTQSETIRGNQGDVASGSIGRTCVHANVCLSAVVIGSMTMDECTAPICSASVAARVVVSSPEYDDAM